MRNRKTKRKKKTLRYNEVKVTKIISGNIISKKEPWRKEYEYLLKIKYSPGLWRLSDSIQARWVNVQSTAPMSL